jgi:pectinesterase
MNSTIQPEGWHNWNKPDAEKTTFYAEFNSKGSGAIGKKSFMVASINKRRKKKIYSK